MLILVGVTINVAINGGLFGTAQFATKETQIEAEKEQLLSAVVASYETETGLISKSKLETNLGTGWSVNGSDGGPYTVTSPKGNVFTVNKDGTIIEGENNIPKALYEYTLAEIIEIAKNSSNAMYYNGSEEEDYVEGESYDITLVIPFSEFWKEGIPDSVKNGTESPNGYFDYEYIVTVEKFPYIEVEGNLDLDDYDRGLIFAGVNPETAKKMGIETTENYIVVMAISLTESDNSEQIKIKIQEPEPEPEFNSFTLGDLVDAGTLELDKNNVGTGYFDIPVADFNEIIGQDITKLGNYKIEYLFNENSSLELSYIIRGKTENKSIKVYNLYDLTLILGLTTIGCTTDDIQKTELDMEIISNFQERNRCNDNYGVNRGSKKRSFRSRKKWRRSV